MLLLHPLKSLLKLSASIDIYLLYALTQQCFEIEGELILEKINSELSSVQLRDYLYSEEFQKY